jgi:hypothetical protein
MTTEQSVRPPRRASEFLAGFHRADNPDWRISMQTVVRKLEDEIDRLRAELKSETNWLNATKAPKSEPTESGEQPTGKSTTPTCESGDDEITLDMIGAGMLAHLRHDKANVKEIVITVYRAMRAAR